MSYENFPTPVQSCLKRIHALLAREIEGASIQVIGERPGDRINLALTVNDQPIAFNFISEDECRRAYDDDPSECSLIDHFTTNWIQVARVKMKDRRAISDLNLRAMNYVPRAPF